MSAPLDAVEQRRLAAYDQNSENFRSLNQLMWKIPLLAMTLTGGLWFGVSMAAAAPLFQLCLLGLAVVGNVGLCLVLTRLRYIMQRHLGWLEAFDPANFVGAPGAGWMTRPLLVRTTFQTMLGLAAIASVSLMVITATQAGWFGKNASGRSIDFYNGQAESLADMYELVSFEKAHPFLVSELSDGKPRTVLDIGSGSGRDAAWLATHGHAVTAVEPAASFRKLAQHLHPVTSVQWLDDQLPELHSLKEERYDWIVLSAVWMHIHPADRRAALGRLRALLAPGGKIYITLRLGPADPQREFFPLSVEEIRNIAQPLNLKLTQLGETEDILGRAEISWISVALEQVTEADDLRAPVSQDKKP